MASNKNRPAGLITHREKIKLYSNWENLKEKSHMVGR